MVLRVPTRGGAATAVLALALVSPTAALAAGQDTLQVTALSQSVKRGQSFLLMLRGYAARPANAILSFADSSPCPGVYSAEANRARAGQAAYLGASTLPYPGQFGRDWSVLAVKSASMPLGNDYICSYLKDLSLSPRVVTEPTYGHASARFTVTA